jgi:hypothetical protein
MQILLWPTFLEFRLLTAQALDVEILMYLGTYSDY